MAGMLRSNINKIMTIPVPSTRNSHTKIKATQENRFVHRHIQQTRRPRHMHSIHPTSPSNHKVANATSQQMPPRRNRQPPAHNLSWFSAPRRQATLPTAPAIEARDRHRLEKFRRHIRIHDIPYFRASHKVLVRSQHSRQYFRTTLRLLLQIDYVPKKVKIPAPAIPHDCRFCPEVTDRIFCHRRPFEYVLATPRSSGRPRRDTIPPISSTDESESESDWESEDHWERATDDSSSNPHASPPAPEPCLPNTL